MVTNQSIILLNDLPLEESSSENEDTLGYNVYAKVLSKAAINSEGPFTIGVFGEWGTGKTSLLRLIKKRVENQADANDDAIIAVWFNAWRYDQLEHPIIALVHTIFAQFEELKKSTLPEKAKTAIANTMTFLKHVLSGISFNAPCATISCKDMLDGCDDSFESQSLIDKTIDADKIYFSSFQILETMKLEGIKIVVFIDDLDRCLPANAVKLLESIKLVLCQKGFIFFLGMAKELLEEYVKQKYEREYGIVKFDSAKYLDKLIQLPFYLPPAEPRLKLLIKGILSKLGNSANIFSTEMLECLGNGLDANPRAIVRLVNNLCVDSAVKTNISVAMCGVTRVLQQRWPEFFDLVKWEEGSLTRKCFPYADTIVSADKMSLVSQLNSQIQNDNRLKAFLKSPLGKEWLKNGEERKKSIEFLSEIPKESFRRSSRGVYKILG